MTTLKISELTQKRDEVRRLIDTLADNAQNDLMAGRISINDFQLISHEVSHLTTELNRMNTQLLLTSVNEITVGPDSPAADLNTAIESLTAAADKLDDVRNSLLAFAAVVDALTSITKRLLSGAILPG